MVEVFKTDVAEPHLANELISKLSTHCPLAQINFDLEDCDKILRIEADDVPADKIIRLLLENGHHCEILN